MPEGTQSNQPGGTPGGENGTPGGMPGGTGGTQNQQATTPPTFDAWLAGQDEATKNLLDGHTKGLQTALASERAAHSDLAKQVKDLAAKAEKGSDAEKTLTELSGKLQVAEARAAFFEEAIKPEVGCTNPTLAFLLAREGQYFSRRGDPDWEAIRKAAPELFRAPGGTNRPGSADGGAGGNQQRPFSMNDAIRRGAGRG